MELRLIRNATMRLKYGGRLIVTDPYLAEKHSLRSFAGISPNPLVELPCKPAEVLANAELVIISHLHTDHFDEAAQALLPNDTPILCQPGDEGEIKGKGFRNVTPLADSLDWQGISILRTAGRHGSGELAEQMGKVSGFLLRAEGEPAVYWAGDTVWYEEVARVVEAQEPDVVITHSSGASFGDSDPIVMDAEQTIAVCLAAPKARVVAVHMDSLDHGTVSRKELRAAAESSGISDSRLLIPADGETLTL
jgi:L-ascorbate metabolism protein UlaG (beta-lactamase superfamily)